QRAQGLVWERSWCLSRVSRADSADTGQSSWTAQLEIDLPQASRIGEPPARLPERRRARARQEPTARAPFSLAGGSSTVPSALDPFLAPRILDRPEGSRVRQRLLPGRGPRSGANRIKGPRGSY